MLRLMKCVLTIGGSDSGAGAGIQADLKTFAALDCYGTCAIVAITAQNTTGVLRVEPISQEMICKQLEAVFSDFPIHAVKIGMLWDVSIIETIIEKLPRNLPIVVDPVMAAKDGSILLKPEGLKAMKKLFSFTTIVTPNLPEASILLGRQIKSIEEMENGARQLLDFGSQAVLVKGGHLYENQGTDCLMMHEKSIWFEAPAVATRNTHGTGCVFSSAIAAFLANGEAIEEAVRKAKAYLHRCLDTRKENTIGRGGYGPVRHIF